MPKPIHYGAIISLKHQATGKFLYSDSRIYTHAGTSGQQIVAASDQRDDDSCAWMVMPEYGVVGSDRKGMLLRNNDRIRLRHVPTKRNLHSHKHLTAAHESEQQEVTCYEQNDLGDTLDNWTLEINAGDVWNDHTSIKLIHTVTSTALHSHPRIIKLPRAINSQEPTDLQEVTCFTLRDHNDFWSAIQLTQKSSVAIQGQEPSFFAKNKTEHPHWLVAWIQRDLGTIKDAPVSFFGFLILGGLLVFLLYSIFIIPGKDSTIELLRTKADAAPSTEQQKTITELTAKVAELQKEKSSAEADEWPPLSDTQISDWATVLSKYKIKSITVSWNQDVNTKRFYESIKSVCKKINIPITAGWGVAGGNEIEVLTAKVDPVANAIFKLFQDEKYPVVLTPAGDTNPNEEISIFIGPMPSP